MVVMVVVRVEELVMVLVLAMVPASAPLEQGTTRVFALQPFRALLPPSTSFYDSYACERAPWSAPTPIPPSILPV